MTDLDFGGDYDEALHAGVEAAIRAALPEVRLFSWAENRHGADVQMRGEMDGREWEAMLVLLRDVPAAEVYADAGTKAAEIRRKLTGSE